MQLQALYQKIHSLCWEHYLGIQTTGKVNAVKPECGYYSALPYLVTRDILAHLKLNREDVFIDVGCGKGRVVCCACRLPLRRVVALEVNEDLLRQAMTNASRVRGRRSEIEPVAGLAEDYHFVDATALCLFNPFGVVPMAAMLKSITASYRARPRRIKIAYANCLYEQPFEECGWLRKCEEWPAARFPGFARKVSFWQST